MTIDRFENHAAERRDVDQSALLLKRLYLVEREVMRALGARHITIATWSLKTSIPRHWWQDSLHADALRSRVLELRYPRRDVDRDHDPDLVAFLAELTRADDDAEFALGIYRVVKPALIAAYEAYGAGGDSLADAPSVHHCHHALIDERMHLQEIEPALADLSAEAATAAQPWLDYLRARLDAIGGVLGQGSRSEVPASGRLEYVVPERAVRDPGFSPAVVESPTRRPESRREEQVWYAIDHANEVWAAEVPGAFMWQFPDMPWAFYLDVARWGYDEMRHARMGMRRLEAWGFEIGIDYPMVGDPIHAIYEKGGGPLEILALLYYFEKDAPAHRLVTKREFTAIGDSDTAFDTDFDWADEAIHLRYGYTWLQHIVGADKKDELNALVQRAGRMWDEWLAERWERGEDGYGPFMERIDARIRAAREEAAATGVA